MAKKREGSPELFPAAHHDPILAEWAMQSNNHSSSSISLSGHGGNGGGGSNL